MDILEKAEHEFEVYGKPTYNTSKSMVIEIESLRAQLKAAQEQKTLTVPDYVKAVIDAWNSKVSATAEYNAARDQMVMRQNWGDYAGDVNIEYQAMTEAGNAYHAAVKSMIETASAMLAAPIPAQQSPAVAQGELIKGDAYQAGLWSMRNAEAMIQDGNVINGLSPVVVVPDVTPEMLRAAQLRSELGAYACSNLSGGYDLIRELFEVMISKSRQSPRITEQDAREIVTRIVDGAPDGDSAMVYGYDFEKERANFIESETRALLDKLNNPDSVGG